jgi:hypothetical protein
LKAEKPINIKFIFEKLRETLKESKRRQPHTSHKSKQREKLRLAALGIAAFLFKKSKRCLPTRV